MVIINYKFHYTQRKRGNMWQCWHTSSHICCHSRQYLWWERVTWCVWWWGGLLFSQLSIHHSFIPGDIQQLEGEGDRTREGDERSTRVWEVRQRQKKSKDKKKRRWLVMDDFRTIQILENRKTQRHAGPQNHPTALLWLLTTIKIWQWK